MFSKYIVYKMVLFSLANKNFRKENLKILIIPFSFFLPLPLHSIPKQQKSQNQRYDYFIYFIKLVKKRITVFLSKQNS